MKEYLEEVIHQNIDEFPYENEEKLPLACRNAFKLYILKIREQEFLMAEPIEDMNLTELRKMRIRLERYTGYLCAFYLRKSNWYAAPKMVEEGIPFVWEKHQVYLPFIGVLLQNNYQRQLKRCTLISFLTQKLLLKALYENWQDVSAIQASRLLEVSRMSITRCFDEIESMGMPFLKTQSRSRRFHAIEDKKAMWEIMLPFMRNPIIHTFRPEKKPELDMILSGISALSEYSMLDDDRCMTYAIQKNQVKAYGLKEINEVPLNEKSACIIQEVGYILPYQNNKIDPLSLKLMLTEEENNDPRVKICMDEVLEELVW